MSNRNNVEYPNKWAEWTKKCKNGMCYSPNTKFLYTKIFFPKDKFSLAEKIKAILIYRIGLFLSSLLILFNLNKQASSLKDSVYKYLNYKIKPYLKNI